MQTNSAQLQAPLYKLKIEYDDMPLNPRTDNDNFGTMVCWHRRYDLGDKHSFSEPKEFLKERVSFTLSADEVIDSIKKGEFDSVRLVYDRSSREWLLQDKYDDKWFTENTFWAGTLKGSETVKECILDILPINALEELADRKNVILPLYLYDHSGITISCSHSYPYNDRWDAGQVGWVYADFDKVKAEYGAVNDETTKKAEHLLISETKTYDDYLRGDCYGYIIEKNGVEVESCWGYLGDLREMISEMKSSVDKEYQHLFDHVDYCQMEYSEDSAVKEKPSIRKQLAEIKQQKQGISKPEQQKKRSEPEIG